MTKKDLLAQLETIAKQAGVKVIYDDLQGEGGFCRCKDRAYLIINSRLSQNQKIDLLVKGLANIDLNGIPLLPEVRILLDRQAMRKNQPEKVLVRELVPTRS